MADCVIHDWQGKAVTDFLSGTTRGKVQMLTKVLKEVLLR